MVPLEVRWRAPEFEYHAKGVSWYWVSIIISVAILASAVWQRNFLFGFFVVIAEILILVWANREPASVDFVLNEKGLRVGSEKFHTFAEIENFSLEPDDVPWPILTFQFRKKLRPSLRVRVPKDQRPEIQKYLSRLLTQAEHQSSLMDTFEEYVGF